MLGKRELRLPFLSLAEITLVVDAKMKQLIWQRLKTISRLMSLLVLSHSVQAADLGTGLPRDGAALIPAEGDYPVWRSDKFAAVDGARMKNVVNDISAIALQSKANGAAYWGRLPGTEEDRQTRAYLKTALETLGFEVTEQPFTVPRDWRPLSWRAGYSVKGKRTTLTSAFPTGETAGTAAQGIQAEAIWLGLGAEPDFIDRDVKGKAVIIYSSLVPGGRSHSASGRSKLFYSNRRATEAGAALVINIMGVPGDAQFNPLGAPSSSFGVPLITINQDEGFALRDALGAGEKVVVDLTLDVAELTDIPTANLLARLPGRSDEEIFLAAHTDGFFQGAMDNGSGIATGLEVARYFAGMPVSERDRTLVLFFFPDHHHGEYGLRLFEQAYDWQKVAMAITLEHTSQTQLYWYNNGLMTANGVGAFRWHFQGSDRFKTIVRETLRDNGVSTYTQMDSKAKFTNQAPGFHIIDHVIYHTTLDTPELVPAEGLKRSAKAFLEIIEAASALSVEELRVDSPTSSPTLKSAQ